jgi:hypothetical protein
MKVRKGWLRSSWHKRPIRVIMDQQGNVFFPEAGGWRKPFEFERVILLPGEIEKKNWKGEDWWGKLWQCPEWAWLYEN